MPGIARAVTVDTDLKVVGKLAQFGSGMLQQVSEKLLGEFVDSLEAKLAGGQRTAAPTRTATAPTSGRGAEAPPPGSRSPSTCSNWPAAVRSRSTVRRSSAPSCWRPSCSRWDGCASRERRCAGGDDRAAASSWRRPGRTSPSRWSTGCTPVVWWCPPAAQRDSSRRCDMTGRARRSQLYWAARLTLVNRVEDLAAFDAVVRGGLRRRRAGCGSAGPQAEPGHNRRHRPECARPCHSASPKVACRGPPAPASITAVDAHAADIRYSRHPAESDRRACGRTASSGSIPTRTCGCSASGWSRSVAHWPRRRSLRREPHRHGKRIDLAGQTMKASRATGWETIRVARTRSREHPRRVVAGLRRQPIDAAVRHGLSIISCVQQPCGRREFDPRSSRSRRR